MLALTVGDDQDRRVLWKILRALQKIDSRLQPGSAAPLDIDGFQQALRRLSALIVGGSVAENKADGMHPARGAVAGDGAERCGKKRARHGAGGIEHDAKRFFCLRLRRVNPSRPWNFRCGALAAAHSGIGAVRLRRGKLPYEPCAKLNVLRNRRHGKRVNLFDQAGGQEAAIAAFVVLEPPLERAAIEVVQCTVCSVDVAFAV